MGMHVEPETAIRCHFPASCHTRTRDGGPRDTLPAMSRLRGLALVLTIISLPSPIRVVLVPDPHPYYSVAVRLSDICLGLVFLLAIGDLARAARRPSPVAALTIALSALLLLSFAVHPSAPGAQVLFRYFGAIALTVTLLRLPRGYDRNLLLFAMSAIAIAQSVLSAAQIIAGDLLVPFAHPPIIRFGPFIRTIGTFPDTFVLAGYALVVAAWMAREALAQPTRRRWPMLVTMAIAPVGYSFSRAAAVTAALMTVPLVRGSARNAAGQRLVLVAIVVGALVPAVLTREGWIGREESTSVTSSADIRANLITQTFPLLARSPLLGIGPGNTLDAVRHLDTRFPGAGYLEPPHDVPYLLALEGGIPAGLVALGLLFVIGLGSLRGAGSMTAFASLLPFMLLDNYPWTAPNGPPLVALWVTVSLAQSFPTPESQIQPAG